MKASSNVAAAVLVVCLAGAAFVARRLQQVKENAPLQEKLIVTSPKTARYMSLGYTGLAADIYWTRAVQYFGEKHQTRTSHYELLAPLLDLTTSLDPHLIAAYDLGAFFLAQKPPQGAGDPNAAVRLVEKCIRENPERWRLYFNLGFIHYMERHDYEAAAKAFETGAQNPTALPWMKTMAARMRERSGDLETARYMWTNIYESSTQATMKENAKEHLIGIKVQDDLQHLRPVLAGYTQRNGVCPSNWQQVIGSGMIPGYPLDPAGNPYQLVGGCRVRVKDASRFPALDPELAEVQY